MGAQPAEGVRQQGQERDRQQEGQQQQQRQRTMLAQVPGAPRTTAPMPVGQEYVILEVVKHRGMPMAGGREFLVLWAPCKDNDHRVDEMTWQSEKQLRDDGVGKMLDAYLATCLLYTSPSPRDATLSRMPSSA